MEQTDLRKARPDAYSPGQLLFGLDQWSRRRHPEYTGTQATPVSFCAILQPSYLCLLTRGFQVVRRDEHLQLHEQGLIWI